MTALYERHPKQGQPRVTMHLEALTDACICPRLTLCGGIPIEVVEWNCFEHGRDAGPEGQFHTHPVQARGVNRGRHIA